MKKSILKEQIMMIKPDPSGRFHMPGHKGRRDFSELYELDITEIPGADNLHDAREIIDQVEKKLALVYQSQHSAILVNGSTVGLQSAILASCQPGDELLVGLNCHRSVFGALGLGHLKGRFIKPVFDDKLGFASGVSLTAVTKALQAYPKAKGLVIVSPTYYGTVCELAEIAKILHQKNKILIVDEAHGAQFSFAQGYPQSALKAGADLVIQSTHKVLGSLTQSAIIHGQGDLMDWTRVKMFLAVLQSSSPSYPLMISVEEATDRACLEGAAVFEMIRQKHRNFCRNQPDDSMIRLYDSGDRPYDYSKWLFSTGLVNGCLVEKRLRDEFSIQCEMSDQQSILFMCGLETRAADLEKLAAAITMLNNDLPPSNEYKTTETTRGQINDLMIKRELGEVMWSRKKIKLALEKSANRVAADFVIPYPPGIPMLIPGSLITEAVIDQIKKLIQAGVTVVGLDSEEKLLVLEDKK
jgi:arginine/lysine/ornithine decarboxylase